MNRYDVHPAAHWFIIKYVVLVPLGVTKDNRRDIIDIIEIENQGGHKNDTVVK